MRLLAVVFTLLGAAAVTAGVGAIYPPAGAITGGVLLAVAGLIIDYDRGGKREADRRAPRR